LSSHAALDYRPENLATIADPCPVFARLIDEDSFHWSPRLKSWVKTRHHDVRQACLDDAISPEWQRPCLASPPSEEARRIGHTIRDRSLWRLFKDPPEHTRLR